MREIKPIVKEILVLPAHLIWLSWRISGGAHENASFLQSWKDSKDDFRAELARGARFAFALIGSLGIYAIIVLRIVKCL